MDAPMANEGASSDTREDKEATFDARDFNMCIDAGEPGSATPGPQVMTQFFSTGAGPRQQWMPQQQPCAPTCIGDQSKGKDSHDVPLYGPSAEALGPGHGVPSESKASVMHNRLEALFQPGDNKLALKVFGHRMALMKERTRQKAAGNCIIHPCSNFMLYWNLCMVLLLVPNLIVLPVTISFFNDDLSIRWIAFNCVLDAVFLFDIIINFRTGLLNRDNSKQVILDPRKVACRYLRTWFFLDLISTVPVDYAFLLLNQDHSGGYQLLHAGRALRNLRIAKMLSILRLLRLSRLVRYVSRLEEVYFLNRSSVFVKIVNLICMMLLISHWNGCLQFLVPMLRGFPSDSWVTINELEEKSWFEQYSWSLFKALSQMLCVGYGRFPPQSLADMWLTLLSMISGVACYAFLLGHVTNLILSLDSSSRQCKEKINQVEEYMAYSKLPRNLRQRITDYFEHRYQGKFFDEEAILGGLSERLREDVITYNCRSLRSLVESVPLFTKYDDHFVSDLVSKLKYEVFQPGDVIIEEGTLVTKMYFIQEGVVNILIGDKYVASTLSDGSYFGERFITILRSDTSARAETFCNLFSLSEEHFNAAFEALVLRRSTMESVAS